jgi:hypothetical protein
MKLTKTIHQPNSFLAITINYENKEVQNIVSVLACDDKQSIDITHIMAEHCYLNDIVENIDWREIAMEDQELELVDVPVVTSIGAITNETRRLVI